MATANKGKKLSGKSKVAIGVGALALAAASYYFFGPEGKKHRKSLKGWMIRMKGEIVEKMEQAKDLTQNAYEQIVDSIATRYKSSGVSEEDIKAFAANLKRQWKGFSGSGVKKKGAAKKAAPKRAAAKKKPASK